MASVFEVDYSMKDVEKFKAAPKQVPAFVVADTVQEAVKAAAEFEDDNLTLLKCNQLYAGNIVLSKKFKGLQPTKEND